VPALIARILDSPSKGKYVLDSLQLTVTGGQHCPPELMRRWEAEIGGIIINTIGFVEAHWFFTTPTEPEEIRYRSCGKPAGPYDEYKVVDMDTGVEVAPGVPGELLLRGPQCTSAYYKDPEKTLESFTKDGFYRPGDVVYRDERGYIYYVSRSKDIINRGGEKIGADEIESYIMEYPKVQSVACVGMPDPLMGERVCAFVVLKSGEKPFALSELQEFLDKLGVAKYKWPERLEFVKELPLTPLGKVDRRKLREILIKEQEERRK
jgi:non-ribosomal peptide synthetase component E (peptide arylation enzyme)